MGEDMDATKRLTCEEAVRQFFAYLDRALQGEALESLETHLEACFDCCDRLQFSRQLDAFVKRRLGDSPLPEDLEDRLRRSIARARADATETSES
jgi:anti-sigma factor (TIGR02949 family)